MRTGAKIWRGALIFFAVMTALGALRYALPHVPFPAPLPNFFTRRITLSVHASLGAIACLLGPWQFVESLRTRHVRLHRWIGWSYASAVAASWIASVPLALHAQTGAWASAGFFGLGAFWIVCTTMAVTAVALRKDFEAHGRWMIRSYGLTAAAITLRIYLPISLAMHWRYDIAYPAIAWLCWVPNLIGVEIYLRTRPGSNRGVVHAGAAS